MAQRWQVQCTNTLVHPGHRPWPNSHLYLLCHVEQMKCLPREELLTLGSSEGWGQDMWCMLESADQWCSENCSVSLCLCSPICVMGNATTLVNCLRIIWWKMLNNVTCFFSMSMFLMWSHSLRRHDLVSFTELSNWFVFLPPVLYPASKSIWFLRFIDSAVLLRFRIFKTTVSESWATWPL